MILNATSVIAGFLALVQAGLAVSVIARSAPVLLPSRAKESVAQRDAAEVAALYPALQGGALLVVVLVSWVLLIAVLGSYVPVWPSVMCIDGVTRIGTGTVGAARHLPTLLDVSFFTKPTVVILGAIWVTVHAVRRRANGLAGRAGPTIVAALGGLALTDAVLELTYLGIPKEEQFLSSGCCLVANLVFADTPLTWLEHLVAAPSSTVVVTTTIALALLLGVALVLLTRRTDRLRISRRTVSTLAVVLAGAVTVGTQYIALAVISPHATGISTHRCAWCVVEQMPLAAIAIALIGGTALLTMLATIALGVERRRPSAGDAVSRGLARGACFILVAAAGCALLALL